MLHEYLFLSRGGQGGVTATRILATAAVTEGRYAQAIPEFGAERRGAIVRSYLRIGDEPIKRHSRIRRPEGVIVFSQRIAELVGIERVSKGARFVLVNTSSPRPLPGVKVFAVDATRIAVDLGLVIAGWPVVNTAMAGAFARVVGIGLDALLRAMEDFFRGKLLETNREAAKRAYELVREVRGDG